MQGQSTSFTEVFVLSEKRRIARHNHMMRKILAKISRLGEQFRNQKTLSLSEYYVWITARLSKKTLKILVSEHTVDEQLKATAIDELVKRDILGCKPIPES
jgi:hypothetical protein